MIKSSFSIPSFVASKIISVSVIASTAWLAIFPAPVFAFSLNFTGGTLVLSDLSAGFGIQLVSAQNNTDSIVNDIHLSFSYVDDSGNVVTSFDRTIDQRFGNVNPGGNYIFNASNDIYSYNDILNGFKLDRANIKLSGYWTIDGVPAPEPLTIGGTLVGGIVAFKMRKKLKANAD